MNLHRFVPFVFLPKRQFVGYVRVHGVTGGLYREGRRWLIDITPLPGKEKLVMKKLSIKKRRNT